MVSTLKLTKIQIPNSDSDVISLDASSGNITVPKPVTFSETLGGTSITVQGENTATTNLQQGLAKAFLAYKGNTVNAIYDSNNISSVTDVSTGKQTPVFTNNFNGANDYAAVAFAQQDTGGGGRNVAGIGSPATSNRPYNSVNLSNTLTDMEWINFSFHGDLA